LTPVALPPASAGGFAVSGVLLLWDDYWE